MTLRRMACSCQAHTFNIEDQLCTVAEYKFVGVPVWGLAEVSQVRGGAQRLEALRVVPCALPQQQQNGTAGL